jgi:hypothetical protein
MKCLAAFSLFLFGFLVTPQSANALDAGQLVGTWAVTMSVENTTCSGIHGGDIKAVQFMVSYSEGAFKVQTIGPADTTFDYAGVLQNDGDTFAFQGGKGASSAVVWTTETSPGVLTGRRLVANPQGSTAGSVYACAAMYRVEMKKI